MYKTIIFDLDGLLVNSEELAFHSFNDITSQYGYSLNQEDYGQNYCGKTLTQNMEHIITTYQLPLGLDEGIALFDEIQDQKIAKEIKLKPGAKELLDYLRDKNYKIILASSSIPTKAKVLLKKLSIYDYFNDFIFGYEVAKGKPYPDIFLTSARKMETPTNQCLVLEDSEMGILASYQAHIPVICIPDLKIPAKKYQEMCIGVFHSLLEVIDYLERF